MQTAVATTLATAYENYLSNDHNIPLTFFKDLLRLNWSGLLTIIPILFQAIVNDAVKPTKKVSPHLAARLLG